MITNTRRSTAIRARPKPLLRDSSRYHLESTGEESTRCGIACVYRVRARPRLCLVIYGLLFATAADTLKTIAADPNHRGAQIGFIAVLHTWGQTLVHHPHLHCVIPGGGLSPDGANWISCRNGFFLPVRVLSCLLFVFTVKVSQPLVQRIRSLAAARGQTLSAVVTEALEELLRRFAAGRRGGGEPNH